MATKWLPIDQCPKQEGCLYLITGWAYNKIDGDRWYALAEYHNGYFLEPEIDIEMNPPTHFAYFTKLD